jgi:hypothetical protein
MGTRGILVPEANEGRTRLALTLKMSFFIHHNPQPTNPSNTQIGEKRKQQQSYLY